MEFSIWVVLGGGCFRKKYICVFGEFEVNFLETLIFILLRLRICFIFGMNKLILFSFNFFLNLEFWLGFDGGYLVKNLVCL